MSLLAPSTSIDDICETFVSIHNYCEFMDTMVVPCLENGVLKSLSLIFWLPHIISVPSAAMPIES